MQYLDICTAEKSFSPTKRRAGFLFTQKEFCNRFIFTKWKIQKINNLQQQLGSLILFLKDRIYLLIHKNKLLNENSSIKKQLIFKSLKLLRSSDWKWTVCSIKKKKQEIFMYVLDNIFIYFFFRHSHPEVAKMQ